MSKSKNMRDHANDLADRITPHVENVRDKAGPMITEAREKAAPMITEAREKAAPMIADAREKTGPMIADARDKAGPVLTDARSRLTNEVLPVIVAAVAAASEATEDVRAEAMKRGAATAAALKGEIEVPRKNRHRVRKFLVVLGLGGIAAAVAKKLSDREATTAWQSSYQPTPATSTPAPVPPAASSLSDETPLSTAAAAAAADEGASAPDEAAADAAEHPHAATTPDHPAEEVNLENKQDG